MDNKGPVTQVGNTPDKPLNTFQRFAIFSARAIGFLILALGVLGPAYAILMMVLAEPVPPYSRQQWIDSFVYVAEGIALYAFANRIGRALGKGLG